MRYSEIIRGERGTEGKVAEDWTQGHSGILKLVNEEKLVGRLGKESEVKGFWKSQEGLPLTLNNCRG